VSYRLGIKIHSSKLINLMGNRPEDIIRNLEEEEEEEDEIYSW
jgi:hypothetical protein